MAKKDKSSDPGFGTLAGAAVLGVTAQALSLVLGDPEAEEKNKSRKWDLTQIALMTTIVAFVGIAIIGVGLSYMARSVESEPSIARIESALEYGKQTADRDLETLARRTLNACAYLTGETGQQPSPRMQRDCAKLATELFKKDNRTD